MTRIFILKRRKIYEELNEECAKKEKKKEFT
jgi:hypothetical protein